MNFCILFASVISVINSDPLSDDIRQYFSSESVKSLRLIWDNHRTAIEHSLAYSMQDNISKDSINKIGMHRAGFRLTKAYYHRQGSVDIVMRNLNLMELPYSWLPNTLLSLESNVLQIHITLTKMVIGTEYMLLRNNSDIIEVIKRQDPEGKSPFLYKKVLNMGQLTLFVDGCVLSGYVIAKMRGGTVDLAHDDFSLTKCKYTVMMYNKDSKKNSSFIAQYSTKLARNTLGITHYLLMTIREEVLHKLQAAIFIHVNNTAIFGRNCSYYESDEENLFNKTSGNLTQIIKEQNQKMLFLNGGTVNITDYVKTWNYWDSSFYYDSGEPATIKLSKMVLTGLDTAYNSYTGGPYKLDTVLIGEQMRFQKIQVSGELSVLTQNVEIRNFSVVISDFAINIDINIENNSMNQAKLKVVGYRDIEFLQTEPIPGPLQTLITGYVKDEVSKQIIKSITDVARIPVALPSTIMISQGKGDKVESVSGTTDIEFKKEESHKIASTKSFKATNVAQELGQSTGKSKSYKNNSMNKISEN